MTMTKGKTPPPKKKKGPALRVITLIGDSAFFLGVFIEYHELISNSFDYGILSV